MELRHLRYFVMLAETGHFGQAAQQLNIVQPALSMQIRALEEEIGGPLFSRSSRRVELTQAGKLLLVEAQRVLDQAGHAKAVVQRSLRGETGSVRVGFAGNAVLSGKLTEALRLFRASYPDAQISVRELAPSLQKEALLANQLDVGYGNVASRVVGERLRHETIGEWPMVAAMSSDHPLAARKRVSLRSLRGETLIAYSSDGDDAGLIQLHEHLGVDIEPGFSVSSTLSVLALAAAGLGIALVPRSVMKVQIPRLTYRPIADATAAGLSIMSRADETSGAVLAFLALARKAADE